MKTTQRAIDQFHEDHQFGLWELYAQMQFSPKYCYEQFIYRDQMQQPDFNRLLKKTGIKFNRPSLCRDEPHKR